MVTAGLVLFALLLLFAAIGVVVQSFTSPFWCAWHFFCGTLGLLGELFAATLDAIGSALNN